MIKILIDSSSDIDSKEADELGVTLAPMQIRFGDTEYLDGVDLSRVEFFDKLIECAELPQTSQINEYRFDEYFGKLTQNGDEVIAITISSRLSGTYDCARRAAEKYGNKVQVVDSLNASAGERILCMLALKLINDGLSCNEIVCALNKQKSRIRVLALLGTLEYLRRGGRISSAAAAAGKLFSIRPVISVIDGTVRMEGKAMGSKSGENLLTKFVDKYGIDFNMPHALVYSGKSDVLLEKYVADSEAIWKGKTDNIPRHMIGSTIGTHIGPGAIGVAFFAK